MCRVQFDNAVFHWVEDFLTTTDLHGFRYDADTGVCHSVVRVIYLYVMN